MKLIARSEGASLRDAVRIVVYVTDMSRLRPLVNKVQEELWGGGPYPPRTIVEVAIASTRTISSRSKGRSTRARSLSRPSAPAMSAIRGKPENVSSV